MSSTRAYFWTFVVTLATGACSDGEADGSLRAPRVLTAAPMAGGLHVSWVNDEPACETVELERTGATSGPTAEFTLLSALPGAADNKHDATATTVGATYVYRVRCKKAGRYSAYSNELTGVPAPP